MNIILRIVCTLITILWIAASPMLLGIWSWLAVSVIDPKTFWIDSLSAVWMVLFFGYVVSLVTIYLAEIFVPRWGNRNTASYVLIFIIGFPTYFGYAGVEGKHINATDPQLLVMFLLSAITFVVGLWIHRNFKDPMARYRIPSFSFWRGNRTANEKIKENTNFQEAEEADESKSQAISEIHGEIYWEWERVLPVNEYEALLLEERLTMNGLLEDGTLSQDEREWIRLTLRNIEKRLNGTGG